MSMIGYIIGLGDRHLDNVLVDLATGEVWILIMKKTLSHISLSLSLSLFQDISSLLVCELLWLCI